MASADADTAGGAEVADAWGRPLGVPGSAAELILMVEAEALMPPLRRRGGTRAADDAVGDGGALELALALAPASRRGARAGGCGLDRSEHSHLR